MNNMTLNRLIGRRENSATRSAVFVIACLIFPVLVVIGNLVIGALAPITRGVEDDISFIDPVWRLVQGNHLGIDYQDPRGFGFFYLAAMLWHWLGPHYYVLRAAADIFALVIVSCAFVVASRQLRRSIFLSALFCVTVAFEASAPSVYGFTKDFGMTLVYDRLIMASLLVLFVQSFARGWDLPEKGHYFGLFVAALLLNTLFLLKISGPIVGLAIILGGFAIARRPFLQRVGDTSIILCLFFAMVAVDFVITGTRLSPLIEDYRLAAQARTGAYSFRDVISFSLQLPLMAVIALMVLYSLSQHASPNRGALMRCWFAVACFWVFQVVLNMSNATESRGLLFLAPGAMIAVLTWVDSPATAGFWDRLWERAAHPTTLNDLSARHLIPLLIVGIVLVHEGLGSFEAALLDYRIAAGRIVPLRIAGSDGVVLETLISDPYGHSMLVALNDGIEAIENLGLEHDAIANIDFSNPFPALFLGPEPKGGETYWDFGNNLPLGYKLTWADVIGNACVVTEPERPVSDGRYERPLLAVVEPYLETAFTLVYEDPSWKIWRKSGGCAAKY